MLAVGRANSDVGILVSPFVSWDCQCLSAGQQLYRLAQRYTLILGGPKNFQECAFCNNGRSAAKKTRGTRIIAQRYNNDRGHLKCHYIMFFSVAFAASVYARCVCLIAMCRSCGRCAASEIKQADLIIPPLAPYFLLFFFLKLSCNVFPFVGRVTRRN